MESEHGRRLASKMAKMGARAKPRRISIRISNVHLEMRRQSACQIPRNADVRDGAA